MSYRQNIPVELVEHIKDLPNDTSVWRKGTETVFLSKLGRLYYQCRENSLVS